MDVLRYLPLQLLLLGTVAALIVAALVAVPSLRRGHIAQAGRHVTWALLIGATLAALIATLAPSGVSSSYGPRVNLTPGAGIRDSLGNLNRDLGIANILGNVIMFTPLGFLLKCAWNRSSASTVGSLAAFSCAIELVQLITGRTADIDDVLLNTLGASFGVCVATLAVRAASRISSILMGGHRRSGEVRGPARRPVGRWRT